MYLKDMRTGQSGTVIKISKGHTAERRLFEIGLVPGASVQVVSRHPFNGPLLLQVGKTRVAVGRRIAEAVEVELSSSSGITS